MSVSGVFSDVKNYRFVITVNDSMGATCVAEMAVKVFAKVNHDPYLVKPLSDLQVHPGVRFKQLINKNFFFDADNDPVSLEVFIDNGVLPYETIAPTNASAWLSFDAVESYVEGVPPFFPSYPSTVRIVVKYTDGFMATPLQASYELTVSNQPPQMRALIPNQTVQIEQQFSMFISQQYFLDVDDDAISYYLMLSDGGVNYEIEDRSAWLLYNALEQRIYGYPKDAGDLGALNISVLFNDGVVSANQTSWFLVFVINNAPILLDVFADLHLHPSQGFQFVLPTYYFYDIDGNSLQFDILYQGQALSAVFPWMSYNALAHLLMGTPNATSVGHTYTLTVYFKDYYQPNFLSNQTTPLQICIENTPPEMTTPVPISDQVAHPGQYFELSIRSDDFRDADGDAISFALEVNDSATTYAPYAQVLPWLYFELTSRRMFGRIPLSESGRTYSFRVLFNDSYTPAQSFTFKVGIWNAEPYALTPLPDLQFHAGGVIDHQFDASNFVDDDMDALTFEMLVYDGAALLYRPLSLVLQCLAFARDSLRLFGMCPQVRTDLFRLTFADGIGPPQHADFTLELRNTLPVNTSALPRLRFPIDNIFSAVVDASIFSDADGDVLAFRLLAYSEDGVTLISYQGKLNFLTFESETLRFTGCATDDRQLANYSLVLRAEDGTQHADFPLQLEVYNTPPRLLAGAQLPDYSVHVGNSILYAIDLTKFQDDEGHEIRFDVLVQTAAGVDVKIYEVFASLYFDEKDQVIYGISAPLTPVQTYTMAVYYYDRYSQADKQRTTFAIHLENQPPFFNRLIQNQTSHFGTYFGVQIPEDTCLDGDSDAIKYELFFVINGSSVSVYQVLSWIQFDADKRLVFGTSTEVAHIAEYVFNLTCSDGLGAASQVFSLNVTNNAPELALPVSNLRFKVNKYFDHVFS